MVERFRRLLAALDGEAQLNVVGRLMCRHDVLRHLCTRLQLEGARKRNLAIADEIVTSPILVTGPARSGTSILHELLARDPQLRAPLPYEMAYPDNTISNTMRAMWAEPEFDFWNDVQPEFRAVHDFASTLPEECLWLMAPDFDSGFWSTCVNIPTFNAWTAPRDPVGAYPYHRKFLQHLQHGNPGRTWVLKSPLHLSRLPALFTVYPDARVLMTHRDPARTVPSTVSAVAAGRWMRSDATDPLAVAATVVGGIRMIMNNVAAHRDSLPLDQIANIQYLDLLNDPVKTITSAYEAIGLPITEGHGTRIREYLAARPQAKRGSHNYGPEDFGLNADQIREDFKPYINTFNVKLER